MKKSFLSKALVAVLVLLSIFAMTFVASADVADTDVAKIGDTGYATLEGAIAAANAVEGGATVEVLNDITLSGKITISGNVTIKGAHIITRADNYTGTLFTVNAGATLTLDGGLVIDGNNNWTLDEELYNKALNREVTGVTWADLITSEEGKPNATAPMFKVTGALVAKDVTIQNNYSSKSSNNGDYGVFQVDANATLTMTGATIQHIVTGGANSVAHLSTNSVWTINDGTLITDTFAAKNGGVCRNDSGVLVMNGGTVCSNRAMDTNGTFVMLYKGSMEMNGGTICHNTGISGSANGRCAPIYGHSTSTFVMNGGKITENQGTSYGGIDVPSSIKVEISGGYVGDNISSNGSSNADLNGNSNTVISGGTFTQALKPEWLAPGLVLEKNDDGTYGTKEWYDANATTLSINNAYDLLAFAAVANANAGNTFSGKTIVLNADVDLGGITWTPIKQFSGKFDGNYHTISNFKLDATAGRAAFFYKVYGASVEHLTLSNITATVGKNQRVAALTVGYELSNINYITVKNFTVTTTGASSWIAGLACSGYVNSEVTMNNCTVENFTVTDEYGAQFIAGITAVVQRNGTEAEGTNVLEGLRVKNFKVTVNGIVANGSSTAVGGLIGQTQSVWQNPHFKNCSVTDLDVTATGRVDVGGFMAHPGSYTYATNCTVEGKIDVTGVTSASNYAGGFFGDYGWGDNVSKGDHKITNCTANVDIITKVATAGGFVGSGINTENRNKNITFTNCAAKGTVTLVEGGTAIIGGFAGNTDRGIYIDCTAATPEIDFIGAFLNGKTHEDIVVKNYVAQIGDVKYENLADAIAAAKDAGTAVTVLKTIVITEDCILDLQGVRLNAASTIQNAPVFRILANVTVINGGIVDGRGPVAGEGGINCYAFIVGNAETAGTLTITGGTYRGVTTAISITNGTVNISGGTFQTGHDEEGTDYGTTYLLNCMDAAYKNGTAKFNITGGKFVGFNPANNAAEGEGTNFLAGNYAACDRYNDGKWYVAQKNVVVTGTKADGTPYNGELYFNTIYDALDFIQPRDTATIKLLSDFTITADQRMFSNYSIIINAEYITLDLNGKTILFDYESSTATCYASFAIYNAGSLIILDSSEEKTGTIYSKTAIQGKEGPRIVWVTSAGTCTINGGNFISEQGDTMFYTSNSNAEIPTTLTINDGYFEHTIPTNGTEYRYVNQQNGYEKQIILLNGGVYKHNPTDGELKFAEGFAPAVNEDGSFGVKECAAVVNKVGYETLKEAIVAANKIEGGATVTLLKNVTLSETLTISKNITITGEHTITRGTAGTLFKVDKNATLTLDGGVVIDGGNNWTFDSENFYADLAAGKTLSTGAKNSYSTSAEGGIVATAKLITISGTNGAVVMKKATIQNVWADNHNNGALFSVPAGATLTINDGALISHIRASVAGELKGTWTMNGGEITGVHGHNTNGALTDIRGGTFTINGGEITGNTMLGLNNNGSGALAQVYGTSSKLIVNDGNIYNNANFCPGGGWGSIVYLNNGGKFVMNGGTIGGGNSDKSTTIGVNSSNSVVALNAGTINVAESTAGSYDSLLYGNITVGAGMTISGGDVRFCGNSNNTIVIEGTINSNVLLRAENVTNNGVINGDVIITKDAWAGNSGNVTISGGTWNGTFTVEEGANLSITGGVFATDVSEYCADGFKMVQLENGTYGVATIPVHKVATKAELNAALAAANEGDIIRFTADIDYGTDQLAIAKAITLDLGGYTLTTGNAYGGMSVKNNATIKNGTIVHASNTAAIKVWNAVAFENLVIDVQGKGDANKTIGGIVLQSGSTTRVDSIKNVTIKGTALTNGIETYNCGDATENVIGSMENVTIDAVGTGMLISAPCGTATNCSISGGVNGIEIWIKGTYSATLNLVNSTVTGGVYAHDEFNSNPDIVNNGKLSLTVDETTALDDVTLTLARAENVEGVLKDIKDNAQAKIGNTYYATLADAIADAQDGDTIKLLADIALDTTITNNKKVTLNLNGKTITGTDNATGSFGLITNRGELTITGNGTITLVATNNRGWNAYSSVISNTVGGKLVVENGTIEHLGGTDMAYAIDNLTNGKGTYAETVINGGTIKSTYRAIRMFLNGIEAQNILTVNGGTIEGVNKSIWMQDPSKNANTGTLTVGANAILNGDVYLFVTAGSTEWPVEVSIAASALNGESKVVTGNVPEKYVVTAVNGTWGVTNAAASVNGVGYATLEEAFEAAWATVYANAGATQTVYAAGEKYADLGTWGGIDWTLYVDGTLVIAPTAGTPVADKNAPTKRTYEVGEMPEGVVYHSSGDYATAYYTPYDKNLVKSLVIEDGVTTIGSFALKCPNLTGKVVIPASVIYVGQSAFQNAPITELIFEGDANADELCIAVGAFEGLKITELKIERPAHLHAWAFQRCSELESAVLENVTFEHGSKHTKYWYYGEEHASGNSGTWDSNTFAHNSKMKELVFGTETGLNQFLSAPNSLTAYVARNGLTVYFSLTDAIAAANAGDKITFLADIEENVTINKNLTIDGAEKNYTGTMTINNVTVIIENVNFVKGNVYKNKNTGTTAKVTIKNCDFDGQGLNAYAINLGGTNSIVIENVTAKDYGYGLLQVPSSCAGLTVKDVTVSGCYYGLKVDYANAVTLENVTITGSDYGIYDSNYGDKTYTIKNSTISSIKIWERPDKTYVTTFKFEGANTVAALSASQYAKYVLAAVDATLTAPAGYNVTTNIDGYVVKYMGGTYKLVKAVAEVGGVAYGSLQAAIEAAQNGQIVKLLEDITVSDNDINMVGSYKVMFNVDGKNITLDLNGKTINVDYNGGQYLIAVIRVADGAGLTVTGNGKIDVAENGINVAYMFWKAGTSGYLTIESGYFHMDNSGDSMVYTNGSEIVTINGGTFILDKVGDRTNGFPCIFNTQGNNDKHIDVNGGTFNYDVNHQYWIHEVQLPADKALKGNGDGTWTVVNAVAYIAENIDGYNHYVGYATLQEAIAAAKDGETVVLLKDIALSYADCVENAGGYKVLLNVAGEKAITLDLNGKKITVVHESTTDRIYAVICVEDGASLTVEGNGTIDVTTHEETPKVAYLFWKRGTTGTLTIENGYFHMNNSEDSMVYTNGNRIVTINGGTFILDKVASRVNGFPCILNAQGNNTQKIVVNGGTFNDDINHQYWCFEVEVPKNLALKENGDGTWTVDDAVAYVGEMKGEYTRYVGYATLQEAIAAADEGEVVTLLIALTDGLTIEKNITVVLATDVENAGIFTLATEGAVLVAPTGLTVETTVAGRIVKYVDGSYVVAEPSVKNATTGALYDTLAEAIQKATAGDTITFLADITENVTINKKLTIDGADFNYTGTMTINNVTVTIENVNFVKGQVYKSKSTGNNAAYITIKNCDFDGQGLDAYAINLGGTQRIVIENVTAKDYGYGLLQVPSTCAGLTVKNVTVSGCYYGLKVDYANAVTIEDATIDATIGIYDSNYGNKTYTIKNSTISSIKIWERSAAKTTTFKFEGANTVGALSTSQYAKYVLAKGATLTAAEGYDVTTNAAGYIVKHDGSKYYTVTNFVAEYENMRFGNTLSLLFAVPQYVEFVDGCYVEFVHGDVTVTVDISKWNTTLMNGYYVVEYNGLAAKQMTDVVEVTFYDANGNALGETFTSSIQGYANKALNTEGITDAFQKVVVDMLNYGAAAQTYFGYNTDALANSILNDTQKGLTAFDGSKYLDVRHAQGVSLEFFTASGVRFNDSINLIFQFQGISPEAAANLTVTFKDEKGNKIGDCQKLAWVEADHAWAVELETLAIADAYKVIVCEITDTNNNTLKIQDSVAAYVARRLDTISNQLKDETLSDDEKETAKAAANLYTAFMNFADSAIAYNNGQNAN